MRGVGSCYFVYLPEWSRYTRDTSWGSRKRDDVLTFGAQSRAFPSSIWIATFRASGDPLSLFPFRAVGHYNEIGHRAVAEAVLKAIRRP